MGTAEVNRFLSDLATRGKVSASTQSQAAAALSFLYRWVLERPLEDDGRTRSRLLARVRVDDFPWFSRAPR